MDEEFGYENLFKTNNFVGNSNSKLVLVGCVSTNTSRTSTLGSLYLIARSISTFNRPAVPISTKSKRYLLLWKNSIKRLLTRRSQNNILNRVGNCSLVFKQREVSCHRIGSNAKDTSKALDLRDSSSLHKKRGDVLPYLLEFIKFAFYGL